MVTVDGVPVAVEVAGPDTGGVVVLLGAAQPGARAYDAVCQRLHTATLRTIVIYPDPQLTAKAVVGVLDAWEPNPKFYDLYAGKFGAGEDVFVPFSTARTR